MRRALAFAIKHYGRDEGKHLQSIDGLSVFSCSTGVPRCPMVYEPAICLIAQGRKRIHLGNRCYTYDADSYLINSFTLPVEVEVELPDEAEMFLGLSLNIDRAMVRQVILEMGSISPIRHPANDEEALQASPVTDRLFDAVLRLIQAANDPLDRMILTPGIWREIYLEVLRGPHGTLLHNCVETDIDASRLAPVFDYINTNFDQKLDIDILANVAHMSSSTLHSQFKKMTTLSPMQYIKNLRLHRAHAKILGGQAINQACYDVGYHSPSQFSREFRRFFGVSPSEAAQTRYAERAYLS
jgi:AraC-like DNA-binding protein